MKKIIEYIMLHGETGTILAGAINRGIDDGFQPYGNPFEQAGLIHQAMVKYGDDASESKKQILNEEA